MPTRTLPNASTVAIARPDLATRLLVRPDPQRSRTSRPAAARSASRRYASASTLAALLALAIGHANAAPWTYRGTLSDGGKPAQGQYDLRLTLLDDGHALTQPLTLHGVAVDDGNFAAEVDFGLDLSHAPPLQLRTEVQRSDQSGSGFVALGEPTRFDAKAALGGICWDTLGNAGTNPALNFIGTTDSQPLVLRTRNVQSFRIEPSSVLFNGTPITANVIAGSSANSVTAGVRGATISGGGMPVGDSDPDLGADAPNRVTDSYGTVGGGYNNRVGNDTGTTNDQPYGTVGGGAENIASVEGSVVAGGVRNSADGLANSVGGGLQNSASEMFSTVGGGSSNRAIGARSTVSGGSNNTASGFGSTVTGGGGGTAAGRNSTVAGGSGSCAGGDYSFVGGRRAKTRPGNETGDGSCTTDSGDSDGHNGTFVWADSQNADFVSTGSDQFLVRSSGGMAINSNDPAGNALRVAGLLRVDALDAAGTTTLCRNSSNRISGCSSSARYKKEVSDLELGLGTALQLHAVGLRWKVTGEADLGFIAEEVAALDERLVTRNETGQIEGVKYDRLSAVLAGAVRELAARDSLAQQQHAALVRKHEALSRESGEQSRESAQLRSESSALKARLDALEARLQRAN